MSRPLTNFSPSELPVYLSEIEQSPQEGLRVKLSPGWPENRLHVKTDFSLWYDGDADLGPFWRIFESIQEKMAA